MNKKASSIIQYKNSWHGVSFYSSGKYLTDIKIYKEKSFSELNETLKGFTCGVSLNTSTGFLVHVKLPFGGRRKIGLVINNELAGILPFEAEDVVTDFQEIGKGNVLALSVPRESLNQFKGIKSLNNVTVHCLSALYALRWFKVLPQTDHVLLNIDDNVASVMVFKSGTLHSLRHFFYSPESDALNEAIKELSNNKDLSNTLFYMVSTNENASAFKEQIERDFNIKINMPAPERYIRTDEYPPWLWSAVGSALLSLNPRGEINLLSLKSSQVSLPLRLFLLGSGCLAALSVIVFSLFSINFYFKNRVYNYLGAEQNRIYKTVFPKSPPMKDINRFFEDRIKTIDREATGAGINLGTPPLQVFAEISSRIDNKLDTKINEFICDEKEFTISGSTVSFASVEKMKTSIEEIKDVKDVEIQGVDIAAGRQVKFRIRGKL